MQLTLSRYTRGLVFEGRFVGATLGGTIAEAATGSEMRLRFLDRIHIEDGMVKLVHAYYDTAPACQIQLGLQGPTKKNPYLRG